MHHRGNETIDVIRDVDGGVGQPLIGLTSRITGGMHRSLFTYFDHREVVVALPFHG